MCPPTNESCNCRPSRFNSQTRYLKTGLSRGLLKPRRVSTDLLLQALQHRSSEPVGKWTERWFKEPLPIHQGEDTVRSVRSACLKCCAMARWCRRCSCFVLAKLCMQWPSLALILVLSGSAWLWMSNDVWGKGRETPRDQAQKELEATRPKTQEVCGALPPPCIASNI